MQRPERPTDRQNAPSFRAFFLLATAGWATLLCFGSWYPFRFASFDWSEALLSWLSTDWTLVSKSDFAANFLAGSPLGFAVWMAIGPADRNWRSMAVATATTILTLTFVSTTVEILQAGLATRNSSWLDTAAQVFGGSLGMTVAIIWQPILSRRLTQLFGTASNVSRANEKAADFRAALELYLGGYVIWMWLPFIPAISPTELKEKWRSGEIQLSPIGAWFEAPWQAAYTALAAAVTAIPIGLWFGTRYETALSRRDIVTATFMAVLLVSGLELSQLAIQTRTMSTADMAWSAVGVVIGIFFCDYWIPKTYVTPDQKNASQPFFGFKVLCLTTVFYAILYIMLAFAPFDWVTAEVDVLARIEGFRSSGLPSRFSGNDLAFLTNSIRTALWSLPLGGLCASTWHQAPSSCRGWIAALLTIGTVGICCITELGQLFLASRNCSVVGALVRLASSALGASLVLGLRTHLLRPAR